MPTYDYICDECGFEFETFHSTKNEDFLKTCPECGLEHLRIAYNNAPYGFVKGEPKTLGLLADRNRAKMSKGEYEEKIRVSAETRKDAIKKRKEMDKSHSHTDPVESYEAPWRPGTTGPNMKLASLNEKQTEKYITEGVI